MPLFQKTIQVDNQYVADIVKQRWNINLGILIKASQNHTFQAYSEDEKIKYSVRVTPFAQDKHVQRVSDQIFFVNYLCQSNLHHMCKPIKTILIHQQQQTNYFLIVENLIIVVFQWAKGQPLSFTQHRWLKDKQVIVNWGKFFGKLHKISKQFSKNYPEVSKRIQNWDQMHSSILAGVQLNPKDQENLSNPQQFGIIHGDLNMSNFHYVEATEVQQAYLSVYDTDQVHQNFFLFDLAQSIFSPIMLEDLGQPVNGEKVQGVDSKLYKSYLIEGYQSQGFKVDLQMLERMVDLKKLFYLRFCTRAIQQGDIPPHMKPFIEYIVKFGQPKWGKAN